VKEQVAAAAVLCTASTEQVLCAEQSTKDSYTTDYTTLHYPGRLQFYGRN